jgi:hypothetical protein
MIIERVGRVVSTHHIPEVSGLALGPETGYPEIFHGCPHSLQASFGAALKLGHDQFQIILNLSFISHPNI